MKPKELHQPLDRERPEKLAPEKLVKMVLGLQEL
jgi:hypothetical protein